MRKALSQNPPVTVTLSIAAGFTGRVLVEMENGEVKAQFPLNRREYFGTLPAFLDLARAAGWQVIPPAQV
ncbi:hypothetical protein ACI49Z_000109 [Cronobacter turicensis]|uniref:hypothetical protein n=1 Tax=Cronobacter turicensis TaxID=413502 RepID=UPI001D8C6956|nr:hypothetical protein [Cronobacter turicensis]EGT5683802.1 hypothetical protein [Cronobacter turicensis]EGT5741912.1 hypothetical protein [Cronobacter turicensis]ELY6319601.1 hypothetical protein [Cronobacter turicensis]MDI6433868.1 hypothetical protein [Cronobacter turicensis]